MKKRILALVTVLLLAVLMTVAASATVSFEIAPVDSDVDLEALTEGKSFDVYVLVGPTKKILTTKNYIYRVDGDTATNNPTAANSKVTDELFTVNWNKAALEVSAVEYFGNVSGYTTEYPTSNTETRSAGNGYLYAYFAQSVAYNNASAVIKPTITGVGSGNSNTGALTISYGTKANGFIVRNQSDVLDKVAVAKITFTVVSGAEGGDVSITLDNTYKYDGTSKTMTQKSVGVTVVAGCKHENKVALTPDELAAAGLENSESTCIAAGKTWYYCSDCGENIFESHNKLDHDFSVEKYLDGYVPDCYVGGKKAMFCSTEGCHEYDSTTVEDVSSLGHRCVNQVYLAPTCVDDGYDFYWCTGCHQIAAQKNSATVLSGAYYIDGTLYSDSNGTNELASPPADVVLLALGHDWVKTSETSSAITYSCSRKAECGVADQKITTASTVRYVANEATGTGDGSSKANATTLVEAFKAFQNLPEDVNATIYLIGTINVPQNQVSSNNTVVKTFEEYPHKANITITTAKGESKASLFFEFDTVSQYHLYGPTTFDNVIISSDAKGTTSGSSASISIFARGFRYEATKNLQMASTLTGTAAKITYSKVNGNFSYSTDLTYDFPACKVYLMGGFYPGALYDGANATTYTSNLVINGGQYYVVAGGGRNNSNLNIVDSEINVSIGGNAVIGQLVPISVYDKSVSLSGTVANIHYYGGTILIAYRAEMQARSDNQYTVNHFFHNGSGKMKVGDFQMGHKHAKNINCYYSVTDTNAPSAEDYGLGFIAKGNTYAVDYKETQENMTFTEYCLEYLGGHNYVNNVCDFCGIEICRAHEPVDEIVTPATCLVDGEYYEKCAKCGERLSENKPIAAAPEFHDAAWRLNSDDNIFEYFCSICNKVVATRANTASAIYVSDNGASDGGFTVDYPINDFEKAFELAAAFDGDVTIYVVGSVTVNASYKGSSSNTVFVEPEHSNTITIAGYNNTATLKMAAAKGRFIYALNGDTTFKNIELSSWNYEMSTTDLYSYIVAQHHHLTFGENVSTDFMRNTNQNKIAGSYVIIGGCYHYNYTSTTTSVRADSCPGGDSHVTFYSGSFYNFIGGTTLNATGITYHTEVCNNSNITIEVLGDVSFRNYFVLGSFEKNAGDVTFVLDGNLSVGNHFSLGGVNHTNDLDTGSIGATTLKIYHGSIFSQNAQSSNGATTYRPLGGLLRPENGEYDITRNLDSLTIFYDPADGSAEETALRFKASPHSKTITYKTLDGDYCEVTASDHTPGSLVERVESTCAAQGYEIYVCAEVGCGEEFTVALDPVDHNFGATEIASEATCINPQIDRVICPDCGLIVYETNTSVGPTNVHTYDENNVCTGCLVSKEVYCEHTNVVTNDVVTGCGAGTETVCQDCGKVTVNITSTAHNFGKYTVTAQPTATEPGVKTRTCKTCGKTETAIIYADGSAVDGGAIAVDESGNIADLEVATSKLTKTEKEVLNALLQDTAYGSEVKVSYKVEGEKVTGVTYSIPLPAEFANMHNVKVVVKDSDGTLKTVEFTIDKGYIVFAY